jgi:WS/DGAT/MGAT family acyltransferase
MGALLDRPSALDLAFLDLETDRAPLHVGWTLRFAGPPPSLAALRRHLDARLGSVPRFRSRLARGPLGLGDLHWADDPVFDVARHVHHVAVPAPGGPGELRDTASALLGPRLPLDRPLWRMHLVTGLADGWALVGQVHHVLVDGVAAVEVALLLFDGLAEAAQAAGHGEVSDGTWIPRPAPSPMGVAARSTARRVAGAAGLARSVAGSLAAGAGPGAAREAVGAAGSLARGGATALERSATDRRLVAFADTGFDDAREVGRRHGATVNDVLLAASAIALRAALARRGEAPDEVKVLVPVSVRDDDPGQLGNRISFLGVELPVAEPDPFRVLRVVRARTRAAKGSGEAGSLTALTRAADLLPGPTRRSLTRTLARRAAFTAIVSNVPGPPLELALLGRPLRAIHPMVPLLDGHALTIGCVSYGGRLHLGLGCDAEIVPDAVEVARDLERAFDALRAAEGPGPTPWAARARARRDRLRVVR